MKNKLAFTMIELILVVILMGVLAAVAIPKLAATRDDARQKEEYSYNKIRQEVNLVWKEYKKQNPYRSVAIESLIETGILTLGLVSLPETGAVEAILYVTKNISGINPKKILTNADRLLPSSESSIVLYQAKKINFIVTKAAFEQYLLKDGIQITFMNTKVVQRNHIFKSTPNNIKLMKNGQAPIGTDGQPVQLHHMQQNKRGTLVEVLTRDEHQAYSKHLHPNRTKSEIDRSKFGTFRRNYWKERARKMNKI